AGRLQPQGLKLGGEVARRDSVPARAGRATFQQIVGEKADVRRERLAADGLEPGLALRSQIGRRRRENEGEELEHVSACRSERAMPARRYSPRITPPSGKSRRLCFGLSQPVLWRHLPPERCAALLDLAAGSG